MLNHKNFGFTCEAIGFAKQTPILNSSFTHRMRKKRRVCSTRRLGMEMFFSRYFFAFATSSVFAIISSGDCIWNPTIFSI